MLASFVLALREGLEAALILGIVLAALRKTGRAGMSPAVWRGAAVAATLSLLAGLALYALGAEFEGRAEQIYEGIAMLSAAALLTWMILWMQRQAGSLRAELEIDVRRAATAGGQRALFWLAFLAVGREGLELALFLTAAGFAANGLPTLLGALLGLGLAAGLGAALYAGAYRLNLRQFFAITNLLLVLFAAGLVAHGVHEFNEAGLIPPLIEQVWDTNAFLDEASTPGLLLKALFGYNGNPSLTEILAYLGYFAVLALVLWRLRRPDWQRAAALQ